MLGLKADILRGTLRRPRQSNTNNLPEDPPPPYTPDPEPTLPRLEVRRPSTAGPEAISLPTAPQAHHDRHQNQHQHADSLGAYSWDEQRQHQAPPSHTRFLPTPPSPSPPLVTPLGAAAGASSSVRRSLSFGSSSRASRRVSPLPTPPYGHMERWTPPAGPASLSTLPLDFLHHILGLTLDPLATPEHYLYDPDVVRLARLAGLFQLRAVDRRFYLISTAVLREHFKSTYRSLLLPGATSDPTPPGLGDADPTSESVFSRRTREAAVLDRFVALRIGEDWRRAESALSEDMGCEREIFSGLQPAARMEDLLLTLPRTLVVPVAPPKGELYLALPLPHPHLAVNVSPLWAQLWVLYLPVNEPVPMGVRVKRILAVEVRRGRTAEETVERFRVALDAIGRGKLDWGQKMG